jgi:hypothetical protein
MSVVAGRLSLRDDALSIRGLRDLRRPDVGESIWPRFSRGYPKFELRQGLVLLTLLVRVVAALKGSNRWIEVWASAVMY